MRYPKEAIVFALGGLVVEPAAVYVGDDVRTATYVDAFTSRCAVRTCASASCGGVFYPPTSLRPLTQAARAFLEALS